MKEDTYTACKVERDKYGMHRFAVQVNYFFKLWENFSSQLCNFLELACKQDNKIFKRVKIE